MSLILWGTVAAASDVTMAAQISRSGSATRAAISTLLSAIAAGIISSDATVKAAAAAAVQEALESTDIVEFSDPAIPGANQWPADSKYALRETDSLGRVSRAVEAVDGTQYMPSARVDDLHFGQSGAQVTWGPAGSGVPFAVTDGVHLSDLAIGDDGRFLQHTVDHLAMRIGGGSGAGGYDVGVVAGQSNAAEASYLELDDFRDEDARLWAFESGQIVPLSASKVNLGTEVARAYLKHAAVTGRRVLLVPAGVGSLGFTTTSIDPAPAGYRYHYNGTWDRTLTADTRNRFFTMVALTNAAMAAAGPGSRLAWLVWSQGEADGGLTQAEYAAKLDDLITAARAAWATPKLPVVVASMTAEMHIDHEGFEQIARALAATPKRVERVGFVWGPANGSRYSQTVHFNYAAQVERSGRIAQEGLLEARTNVASGEPVNPTWMRVTRNGGTATLEWGRPLCHVDSLTVEYSTNAGASWAAATLDTMHGSRATAAVAASTAVLFRITVTNGVGSTMPAIVNG